MKKDHKRLVLRQGRRGKSSTANKQKSDVSFMLRHGKNIEDWPDRESVRCGRSQRLTDDFKPLLRFLHKRVGQPWDKVWSEICEVNDERSLDGWHFRMHVLQLVDTTGEWQSGSFWSQYAPAPHGFTVMKGILRHYDYIAPWRRKAPEAADPDTRWIDGVRYWREDGIWFTDDLSRPITDQWIWQTRRYRDTQTRKWVSEQERVSVEGYYKYQLNKKDKKRLGLK